MLTKQQIDELPAIDSDREKVELTFGEWLEVGDQAKQAIDLSAKLAAIKALCEESRKTGRRLSYLDVLDAIKDGDT